MKKITSAFLLSAVLSPMMLLTHPLLAGHVANKSAIQKLQKLPLPFIVNNDHTDKRIQFYARTFGGMAFITKDGEIIYSLSHVEPKGEPHDLSASVSPSAGLYKKSPRRLEQGIFGCAGEKSKKAVSVDSKLHGSDTVRIKRVTLKETLVGGKVSKVIGEEESVTKVSFGKRNDLTREKMNISVCELVNMGEVYKGIELKLKAYGNGVEKIFFVKPGADSAAIKIKLVGAKTLWVNEEGRLEVETGAGTVAFTKPVAYQEINGKRVPVEVAYRIENGELAPPCTALMEGENPKPEISNLKLTYGFTVASYDTSKELTIDPLLAYPFSGEFIEDFDLSFDREGEENIYEDGSDELPDFSATLGTRILLLAILAMFLYWR